MSLMRHPIDFQKLKFLPAWEAGFEPRRYRRSYPKPPLLAYPFKTSKGTVEESTSSGEPRSEDGGFQAARIVQYPIWSPDIVDWITPVIPQKHPWDRYPGEPWTIPEVDACYADVIT
jgi:hypothetical protein